MHAECFRVFFFFFFFYIGSERRFGHNPLRRVGGIPPRDKRRHKRSSNNPEVCTLPMYQYIVHRQEFLSLEVLNLYLILPNVILPFPLPNISPIFFRIRIIGNTSKKDRKLQLSKTSDGILFLPRSENTVIAIIIPDKIYIILIIAS
jgi:hypothetical protein